MNWPVWDLGREEERYYFSHSAAHFCEQEAWEDLFELIDDQAFLAEQADYFDGFQECSATVERYAIPAVIRVRDWLRFVRYAVIGINLRSLAEELAQPEILKAMALHGQLELARDVAEQCADPLRRASARAVLAHTSSPAGPGGYGREIEKIKSDLDSVPLPSDDEQANRLSQCLQTIASALGPKLRHDWARWSGKLSRFPLQARRVREAAALSWAERESVESPQLWQTLKEADSAEELAALLPKTLRQTPLELLEETLEQVRRLEGGEGNLFWLTCTAVLAEEAKSRPDEAAQAWQTIAAGKNVAWSEEIIRAGSPIWIRLPPDVRQQLLAESGDAALRAAFRVVLLQEPGGIDGNHEARQAALDALAKMPAGAGQLHWSLQYLSALAEKEALPMNLEEECRHQLLQISDHLSKLRYKAAPPGLALYLDLVAAFAADDLEVQIENIVWSPSASPRTLLEIAERSDRERVLAHLLERAEDWAASVAPNEAEGFRLRGALISCLVRRLCVLRQDLHYLDSASALLLPEEQDEIRAALAEDFASCGKPLGRQAAQGISRGAPKLAALLRVLPGKAEAEDLLKPSRLYSSVAHAQALQDELLALSALLEPPFEGADLVRRYVLDIRDQGRRNMALMHLARHLIAFQISAHPRHQDRIATIELVRSALTVGSDELLARLTPAIAALGAQAGLRRAAAEFQEAARRLAQLESVPWETRRDSLEELLDQLRRACSAAGRRSARRLAAPVLESLLDLILSGGAIPAGVNPNWRIFEILPVLAASLERLCLSEAGNESGFSQDWLSRRAKERKSISFNGPFAAQASEILELCLADSTRRLQLRERLIEQTGPQPFEVEALAYLLAPTQPEGIPELAACLTDGPQRDRLCLRLIRHQWLTYEASDRLVGVMQSPDNRLLARIWQGLLPDSDRHEWVKSLAQALERGLLSLDEPQWTPPLERLWQIDCPSAAIVLSSAAGRAIGQKGRQAGEWALRLWLHCCLSPRAGEGRPDQLALGKKFGQEVERALAHFDDQAV